jgi:hypothetical protein
MQDRRHQGAPESAVNNRTVRTSLPKLRGFATLSAGGEKQQTTTGEECP